MEANAGKNKNGEESTPVGFEPTRAEHTGLAGRRLNHSAKVSLPLRDPCPTELPQVSVAGWLRACLFAGKSCGNRASFDLRDCRSREFIHSFDKGGEEMDSSGFEPEAFCMQSRRDTTTPRAPVYEEQ